MSTSAIARSVDNGHLNSSRLTGRWIVIEIMAIIFILQEPKFFFDIIIIDECHRGSAAADSAWREILDHFQSATPKETEYVSCLLD